MKGIIWQNFMLLVLKSVPNWIQTCLWGNQISVRMSIFCPIMATKAPIKFNFGTFIFLQSWECCSCEPNYFSSRTIYFHFLKSANPQHWVRWKKLHIQKWNPAPPYCLKSIHILKVFVIRYVFEMKITEMVFLEKSKQSFVGGLFLKVHLTPNVFFTLMYQTLVIKIVDS